MIIMRGADKEDKIAAKLTADQPYADAEKAARKLIEIAKAVAPVQDGRIHIEKINAPFFYKERSTPAEYGTGLKLAIERGWLWLHESDTYVKFAHEVSGPPA